MSGARSNAAARLAGSEARWLTFVLDAQRFALPLETVERVIRAVEITALPLAPDAVAGVIDVGGRILPVFNLRRRLRLCDRPLTPKDQFILARTARRDVVLLVDTVLELTETPPDAMNRAPPVGVSDDPADLAPLAGVLVLPDGMVLIEDLDRFLSPDEDRALESALREVGKVRAG
jgi:purine-binding chemotaxis protein CheW